MAQSDDDFASSDDDLYPDCDGDNEFIGDALCDFPNNNADCGFDGGDCCECTCVSTGDNNCGDVGSGFFCLDPEADQNCGETASPTMGPTTNPATSSAQTDCEGYPPYMEDGYCDEENNNAGCGFDGGDCCACTCVDSPTHTCGELGGGYDCKDPDVPPDCGATPSPTAPASLPGCTGNMFYYQDGICDDFLNITDCNFDGGDCCACTCREYSPYYDSASPSWYDYCGEYGYDCMDPEAPTDCPEASVTYIPTPSPTVNAEYPYCTGSVHFITDGDCDDSNNNADCDFDGGDCCSCTCTLSACGPYYDCIDPDADCVDDDDGSSTVSDTSSSTYATSSSTRYSDEDCAVSGGDCAPTVSTATSTTVSTVTSGGSDDDFGDTEVAASTVSSDSVASGSIVGWVFVCMAVYCCFGGLIIAALAHISKRCGVDEASADIST